MNSTDTNLTLQQDGDKKLTVQISRDDLIIHAKKYFKWRSGDICKRVSALGSKDYNTFIGILHRKGFNLK